MRFTELASVQTMNNNDVFAIDGNNGTKNYSFGNLKTQLQTLSKGSFSGLNMNKQVSCYKRLGIVDLVYTGDITALSSSAFVTLGKVPAGYEPVEQIDSCITNTVGRVILVRITPAGNLVAFNYGSAITSANNFSFNITYMAAKL